MRDNYFNIHRLSLAVARGFEGKGPECRAALLDAYRLESAYLKGFFQLARALVDAGTVNAGPGTPERASCK
jgi:hypothetical protein